MASNLSLAIQQAIAAGQQAQNEMAARGQYLPGGTSQTVIEEPYPRVPWWKNMTLWAVVGVAVFFYFKSKKR